MVQSFSEQMFLIRVLLNDCILKFVNKRLLLQGDRISAGYYVFGPNRLSERESFCIIMYMIY